MKSGKNTSKEKAKSQIIPTIKSTFLLVSEQRKNTNREKSERGMVRIRAVSWLI